MTISAIVSIGWPIALFLLFRKKFDMKAVPLILGAGAFFVFALTLEPMLHASVLRRDESGQIALMASHPALYALYGCLAAAIFEGAARLISFLILKKNYHGEGAALSYGIGHGAIEAVLLAGLPFVSNAALSIMINAGAAPDLGEQAAAVTDALVNTNSFVFLAGGFERFCAVAIQISLSVLVWHSVSGWRKLWLLPAAILLHALIDAPAMLMQIGVLTSIPVVEALVFVCAIGVCFIAFRVHKSYREETDGERSSPQE
jgi:uncharacterized membrane protein YhfC